MKMLSLSVDMSWMQRVQTISHDLPSCTLNLVARHIIIINAMVFELKKLLFFILLERDALRHLRLLFRTSPVTFGPVGL